MLTALDVTALVGDVYDSGWVLSVVGTFAPDAIVNQLTDLPDDIALVTESHGGQPREYAAWAPATCWPRPQQQMHRASSPRASRG